MANEQSGNQRGGSGNFANDREKASEAGKKGGEHSHGGSQQSGSPSSGGQQGDSEDGKGATRGGAGNFANDREKASEAGKKGGESSRGNK